MNSSSGSSSRVTPEETSYFWLTEDENCLNSFKAACNTG